MARGVLPIAFTGKTKECRKQALFPPAKTGIQINARFCQTNYAFSASIRAIFSPNNSSGFKYAILSKVFKVQTISTLNLIDTIWGLKTGLK